MQKITPFLWFDNNAEEAMNFYVSVFKDAHINQISRYDQEAQGHGTVVTGTFTLLGQQFMALSGGPYFNFTPAVSFFVNCDTQEEIDYYWERLGEGGVIQQCGWLSDKFGLTWQIVPSILGELLGSPYKEKAARATNAMLGMKKLDIAELMRAFEG